MARITDADEAAALVPDGATIATTGSGGGLLEADAIFAALSRRYADTGHPHGLTLIHALGIGDGRGGGLGHFAAPGMVRRIIGGHWSWAPALQEMARADAIEAYSLPAGIISTLLREVGAGRPGVISRIGMGTFVDPHNGGGKCNAAAQEDIVQRIELDGQTYLHYKPLKVDVGLVRGSQIDPRGNLSTVREPADLDAYAVALAAHNSGGVVIAQCQSEITTPFVPARQVAVPGVMIDYVVIHPEQQQSHAGPYDPAMSGEQHATSTVPTADLPTGARGIIARRAARELRPGMAINYGYGIPGGISGVADQAVVSSCWETVEQGIHNGQLLDGPLFGAARFPQAIISSVDQFDFFAGGGLDIAFLGMGELDRHGNVNVSHLGDKLVGPGGFIEITQGAKKVVFCGTFEARGLAVDVQDGRLRITQPGGVPKLVAAAGHVTFSGPQSLKNGQTVMYVTERAVFRLTEQGVELVEVAPGIDIENDIIARMAFRPIISDVAPMALC